MDNSRQCLPTLNRVAAGRGFAEGPGVLTLSDYSRTRAYADKQLDSPEGLGEGKEQTMNRMLLLESVLGHLALLEQKYPKKAASPVARRAKRYIERLRKQH